MLGSIGLDVPRVAHKLDVLSTITNFEPLEPIRETDIKGFLKNERENAILSVIEETRRTVNPLVLFTLDLCSLNVKCYRVLTMLNKCIGTL